MMQPAALRAAWTPQNAHGSLTTVLQHALALLSHVSFAEDGITVARSTMPSRPGTTQRTYHTITSSSISASASSKFVSIAATSALSEWGRRRYTVAAAAQPSPAAHPSTSVPQVPSSSTSTGAFSLEISIQGFEKRYVDMSANALDDLLMLALAPKALSVLPTGAPAPTDAPLALALGAVRRRDVRLPWRRTRFTLLRSPHIDKQGMEQFERREYKTVLNAATNSGEELSRFMEALKMYQFTGVQIKIDVTSAQRLELPPEVTQLLWGRRVEWPPLPAGGAGGAVLGAPTVALPAPRSPEARFREELSTVLRVLRPLVWSGLHTRRRALEAVPEFTAWRVRTEQQGSRQVPAPVASTPLRQDKDMNDDDDSAAVSGGVYGSDTYGWLYRQRMQQQLELMRAQQQQQQQPTGEAATASGVAAGEPVAAAAAYGLEPAAAAELLARIDAELLHVHEAALQGQPRLPEPEPATSCSAAADAASSSAAAAAAVSPWAAGPPALDASKMTPGEYAYAVLKYVQYVGALEEELTGGVDAETDAALQLSAPGLALRLLQLWCAATSSEFKQHLGLPSAEEERRILEEQLRREEVARQAPAQAAAMLTPVVVATAAAPPAGGFAGTVAAVQGRGQVQGQDQPQWRGQQRQGRGKGYTQRQDGGWTRGQGPRRGPAGPGRLEEDW